MTAHNSYGTITSSPPAQVTVSSPLLITTIAGHAGSSGSSDGTNFNSYFNTPSGLAVDRSNNVFVADTLNHTVRMMSQTGTNWVVKTIAGLAGVAGSSNGTNSQARFNQPSGVALDSQGNIFVADVLNYTIRKLSQSGTNWVVTTVAGQQGLSGAVDGTNSNARFNAPFSLAIDSADNLYVGDTFNYAVRKIRQSGTNFIVTTIAGLAGAQGAADGTNSTAQFSLILGLASDATGVLYVSDSETNNTLRKITPVGTNWVVTTLAGLAGVSGTNDGVGSLARFNSPRGLVFGNDGILYVADCRNFTIRGVMMIGTNAVVTTVAGRPGVGGVNIDGVGASAEFSFPWALAKDTAGRLFISDARTNHLVRLGLAQTPPVIVTQPLSQAVNVGGTAQFTVAATGSMPLAYQWLSNGTNIPGANSPMLVLTNRQAADSGTFYSVMVSNSLAAVASDVVELTVSGIQWRLVIDNDQFGIQNGEFGFDLSGGLDATYVIESSTNLTDWFPVATNTLVWGTNHFSEALQTNSPKRFYRSVFFP